MQIIPTFAIIQIKKGCFLIKKKSQIFTHFLYLLRRDDCTDVNVRDFTAQEFIY